MLIPRGPMLREPFFPDPGVVPASLGDAIAFWNMDEPSNAAARIDATGNAHNWTGNSNLLLSAGGLIGLAGDFPSGAVFGLQQPQQAAFNLAASSFHLSSWVMLTSKGADRFILTQLDRSSATQGGWGIYYQSSTDRYRFVVRNQAPLEAQALALSFGSPPLNTWTNIQAWRDISNSTLSISINNGNVDTVDISGYVMNDGTREAAMGFSAAGSGTITWRGLIDMSGIWGRLLTPSERSWLYRSGIGKQWPLNVP